MSNFFGVLIVAVGLSMDTFSLSVIYGTLGINKKRIILLSILVGIFHFIMPNIGELLGDVIFRFLPVRENIIIGIIFMALSMQIISSTVKEENIKALKSATSGLFFAFTVSVDSFSVGLGIHAIYENQYIAAFIFMIISMFFTFLGLLLGKKIRDIVGKKAQIIGIILMFILSLKYLFLH